MGLESPNLDDRTYEEYREDAVKRIPAIAPEWTDHNAHDPGITMVELLAWIASTYGYQLNQITQAHLRKYLSLVGVTPRPPQAATVKLTVGVPPSYPGDDRLLPDGTAITAETPDRQEVPFATIGDVALTAAAVTTVISEHDRGRTDHTVDNERAGRSFLAFGRDATPGNLLYFGFDRDPFDPADQLTLFVTMAGQSIGELLDADGSGFSPSIGVTWEHCRNPAEWYERDSWEEVPVKTDETAHFYTGGRVTLSSPDFWDGEPVSLFGREESQYWLRCRVIEREEPESDLVSLAATPDDELTASLPGVEQCANGTDEAASDSFRIERYEDPPRLVSVETNAVPAHHFGTDVDVSLERHDDGAPIPGFTSGETTGTRNERFSFPTAPVGSCTIEVGETQWERVDNFDNSSPNDNHFLLDRQSGTITFGDGRRGAIPQAGKPVTATAVEYRGGTVGNVDTASTWSFSSDVHESLTVEAESRPTDGKPVETIPEVLARKNEERTVPHRTVTAADYRDLARQTPLVDIARAEALPQPCFDDSVPASQVTVVVIPASPSYRRRAIPTQGMLDAVESYLCPRALLTDRVAVVGPQYVGVHIVAEVAIVDGHRNAEVITGAEATLREFLDPLEGYDGDGWPFDRPVHPSELSERLESLSAVADTIDVTVSVAESGDLERPTALPYPESVTVTVRDEPADCRGDP